MPERRRDLIRAAAALGTAGLVGASGCLGGDGGSGDDSTTYVPNEPDYQNWFKGVGPHDGTVDARGESGVTVRVGANGPNGYYYFDPTAVAVSPGTTVTWDWTGRGGAHNVVAVPSTQAFQAEAVERAFDSGKPVDAGSTTFAREFPSPGLFTYVCEPHRTLGMRGAVFVALGSQGE